MKPVPKVCARVRLIAMPDEPDRVPAETLGTVLRVCRFDGPDAFHQIDVEWDNGRALMLVTPPDRFEILGDRADWSKRWPHRPPHAATVWRFLFGRVFPQPLAPFVTWANVGAAVASGSKYLIGFPICPVEWFQRPPVGRRLGVQIQWRWSIGEDTTRPSHISLAAARHALRKRNSRTDGSSWQCTPATYIMFGFLGSLGWQIKASMTCLNSKVNVRTNK